MPAMTISTPNKLMVLMAICLAICLTGCASSGHVRQLSNPLIESECPALCPIDEATGLATCPPAPETFGDTAKQLMERNGQYNRCAAAARAGAR